MKAQKIKPYYVAVEFIQGDKFGRVEIWKDYDPNFVWGSPLYRVIGFYDDKPEIEQVRAAQ